MKREFSTLVDGRLWSGPKSAIDHVPELKQLGLEVIISVFPISHFACDKTARLVRENLHGLKHRIVIAHDHDPLPSEYIDHALSTNAPTLIHCNAGENRSTAMACCWLIKHEGWGVNQAIDHVVRERYKVLGHEPRFFDTMRHNVYAYGRFHNAS